MSADTPVAVSVIAIDLTPTADGEADCRILSQCAYAVFSGDVDALHTAKSFDSDLMYAVAFTPRIFASTIPFQTLGFPPATCGHNPKTQFSQSYCT